VRVSDTSWRTGASLRRMSALLWGRVVETKLRDLERALKANFDPNQPRVPAGSGRESGRWTDGGGGVSDGSTAGRLAGGDSSDALSGQSGDDSLGEPPKIPRQRPPTSRARSRVYKQLAVWLVDFTVRKRITFLASLLDEAGWLEPAIDSIRTFSDPPKTLEELQQDVSTPAPGYDVHHIVEQTSAERDGFPRSMIDAPENLVRIPRLKHWLITGWYMVRNPKYGGASPRTHLRGKDWAERLRIGRNALVEFGVLKP
jgi:hypothetical protein